MKSLNKINQSDYQYTLYKDYLEQIKKNSLIYSNNPELVIKYFSINLQLSNNIDQIDILFPQNVPVSGDDPEEQTDYMASTSSAIHGTGMFDKYENFTYDIFEFVPVIEMSPFQYSPNNDDNNGTSGSMSLMTIDKPKVGDLFTYYSKRDTYGKNAVDQTEIFQVSSVQMQRTSNELLPIYQLEFKTANILYENLKKFSIHDIFFYDNLQNTFLSNACWNIYQNIGNTDITIFNKNYNKDNAYYNFYSFDCSEKKIIRRIPLIFNNLIKRVSQSNYNQYNFKPISNISADISINEFFENDFCLLTIPDRLKLFFNNSFIISNFLELYFYYLVLNKENIIKDKLLEIISPDDIEKVMISENIDELTEIFSKYNNTDPIAFIDKDLKTNTFLIIDNISLILGFKSEESLTQLQLVIQNNFEIFFKLYENLKNIRTLINCPKKYIRFTDIEEKELFILSNKEKLNNCNYYRIFCSLNNAENAENPPETLSDIYWNIDGVITDYNTRTELPIGDLGLPIAMSYQYGIQYRDIYKG